MRILIITHAVLSPNFGAGQIALNLAEALGRLGHDTLVRSVAASPLPWWKCRAAMRARVVQLAATEGRFDVIDCPETLASAGLRRFAPRLVARSVQPALLYLAHELRRTPGGGPLGAARAVVQGLDTLMWACHALAGWQAASCILSLGARERAWMAHAFPWWREKLFHYVSAPSAADQSAFAGVRQTRRVRPPARRFLWVGRWSAHKGVRELLAFVMQWSKRFPHDSFTIAGCGAEAPTCYPPALLAGGQLRLVPSFERAELLELLSRHDAGLFTSRVEGWGLVLNEMLEAGLTVFATSAGGTRDLQPFFPRTLRPFPPDPTWTPPEEVEAPSDDYYRTFNWRTIARDYVQVVTGGSA